MKDKAPIAPIETRFLNHDKDLVSLSPSSYQDTQPSPAPVYAPIIIASASILLPLLAFSMISEVSGRLVIVAVVGGAAGAIAANYSTGSNQR